MRREFVLVLLGAFFLVSASLPADVIHLKSGKKWEGEIVKETDKDILLSMGTIKLTIKKSAIKKIERKPFEAKKKAKKKEEEPEEKTEDKEEKTAEAAKDDRPTTIPPPPKQEDIWGYQLNSWSTPPGKIKGAHGHKDKLRNTNYIGILDPPGEIAGLVPEDYEAPGDTFSNVYFFRHGDYPEYKTVFYFFNEKLYAIRGKVPFDIAGIEINYAEWVQDRRKELGGESKREADGTIVWDSAGGFARFVPKTRKGGDPSPTDFMDYHDMVLYDKKARQEIFDWVKRNVKK